MTASIDHLHATKPNMVVDETAVARVATGHTRARQPTKLNQLARRYDLHRQPPPAGHLRPLRQVAVASEGSALTLPLGVSGDKH